MNAPDGYSSSARGTIKLVLDCERFYLESITFAYLPGTVQELHITAEPHATDIHVGQKPGRYGLSIYEI